MPQPLAMESEEEHASQSRGGNEELLIRQELESILQHPLFAKSKRYPRFLRFIVEKSLTKDFASLKERVIGIELLGKQGDYDNAADPEVRNIASEVRKRLVQYYQGTSGQRIRIELPAGSYIPIFHVLPQARIDTPPTEAILSSSDTEEAVPSASGRPLHVLLRYRASLATIAVLLLLGAAVAFRSWLGRRQIATPNVLDSFWMPMLHSGSPVVLVIGTRGNPQDGSERSVYSPLTVSVDSASALSRITVFLGTHGENYEIHPAQETQYATLRERPSVLIGGLNNAWSIRLLGNSRYRMSYDSKVTRISILDTTTGQSWIGPQVGTTDLHEHMDYAIVARQKDVTTGGNVIIVAGLGSAGTVAAAEFVTNAAYLQQLSNISMEQNQEFVLATNVIDAVPGPPHIVAMHFWR